MEPQQNATNEQTATTVITPPDDEVVTAQQQQWIDFNAIGGLMTEADGALTPMTITKFSEMLAVDRTTLYRWKTTIPDFWDRVKQRRIELSGQTRLQKVYNGLYLKAAQGQPEAVKLWLQIFDGWQPPSQTHEVELTTGLADLIAKKRLELDRERKTIDATVTDTTPQNNG